MLKMSSAFDVAFFLSMLPYVVNLSGFFYSVLRESLCQ